MDLRELHYFVAVAEELHFARAAERVGINQSPLSKAITHMERHLGVRLFIRTRRSTQLTAVGEALLADARRILAEVDAARRRLLSVASGHRGHLRVGLGEDVAHPRISRMIAESRSDEPQVDIELIRATRDTQLADLRAGLMDVGFVLDRIDVSALFLGSTTEHTWAWAAADIQVLQMWKDTLVAVAREDAALAARPTVTLADLMSEPLVLVGEPTNSYNPREPLVPADRYHRIEHVANLDVLLTLVGAGRGIGLISAAQSETLQWSDLVIRPLQSPECYMETLLLRRKADQSVLVTRFAERAQRSLQGKPG